MEEKNKSVKDSGRRGVIAEGSGVNGSVCGSVYDLEEKNMRDEKRNNRMNKQMMNTVEDGQELYFDELNPSEAELLELEELSLEEECEYEKAEEGAESIYTDDSVKAFLKEMGKFPRLSQVEECTLGHFVLFGTEEEAKEARNKLVESNLRLAVYYAKKFKNSNVEFADLVSMGCEGLIRAAEKFDYRQGNRFSTYALFWIRQSVVRGAVKEGNLVNIPFHVCNDARKVSNAQNEYKQKHGKEASVAELAQITKLDVKAVKAALDSKSTVVSMDAGMGEDGETTLDAFLKDENAVNPQEYVEDNDLKATIRKALAELPEKEAKVLMLRYGVGQEQDMTLDQIASLPEFGISRERVRQIEANAKRRIQRNRAIMLQLEEFAS